MQNDPEVTPIGTVTKTSIDISHMSPEQREKLQAAMDATFAKQTISVQLDPNSPVQTPVEVIVARKPK